MIKNGILYPVLPERKKEIEELRKQFAKDCGIKTRSLSQTRFSKLWKPVLKININPIIKQNEAKKNRKKR